ncbi:MAG: NYN domain-containing protein [Dehalococcoidia bacterium]|jgi:uncharacterized LabA/DUF88 family protein
MSELPAVETFTLFIDAQNVYNSTRRAFFSTEDSSCYGQIKPFELANLIASRSPQGITRQLKEVRIYTGIPDGSKEPKTHSAYTRQTNIWRNEGAIVISRPLRYLSDWPDTRAQQKGIDVAIAVDFIGLAIDHAHDVGVMASLDTDLVPAIEFVQNRPGTKCKIEIVGFDGGKHNKKALRIPGVWCYWINKDDYLKIADLSSYAKQEPYTQLNLPTL